MNTFIWFQQHKNKLDTSLVKMFYLLNTNVLTKCVYFAKIYTFWRVFFIFCFFGLLFFLKYWVYTWKTFKRVKENFRIFINAHFFIAATKWENWGVENIFRINNIWWRLRLDMDNTSNKIAYFLQTIVLKSIHVIDSNWMIKSIFIIKQLLHRLWNPITTKQSAMHHINIDHQHTYAHTTLWISYFVFHPM